MIKIQIKKRYMLNLCMTFMKNRKGWIFYMEIIVGKTAGFCYGVKRAVEGARETLNKYKKVQALGEIVHNKDVIKDLKERGIEFINHISEARNNVIIRAHGISKEIYQVAKKDQIKLIDYTCPKVLKIHEIAEEFADKGYYIFLIGSKTHPENIGTLSYCGEHISVIEKEEDTLQALSEFEKAKKQKLLVIAQTTYSIENFHKIEKIIKDNLSKSVEIIIKNTICQATELRQRETEIIAKAVDCMIIIGGKNSSNTAKLYDIAKKYCINAMLIENAEELKFESMNLVDKIGIMAGASTPKESIEKVVKTIENIFTLHEIALPRT